MPALQPVDRLEFQNSVRDIGMFGLVLIAPGHCTGWRAVNALANTATAPCRPWLSERYLRSSARPGVPARLFPLAPPELLPWAREGLLAEEKRS